MLVACRLAGLSALETYYAGVRARAMRADANSEHVQLLCENQNSCYLCPVAGSNPRLGRHPAAKRKESEFLFFYVTTH
jgi:hypothetical protein